MTDHKTTMEALELLLDKDLAEKFDTIAKTNRTTAEEVLKSFLLDYIISNGHPERVGKR